MHMLAHDVAGEGPAVLLIHEGIADRRMWDPQIGPFTEAGYRVVRCDLRGFGDTPLEPGPFSHVADVEELLEQLGVEHAAVVAGSLGARIALEHALTHPARVDALVLMGPAMRDMTPNQAVRDSWAEEERLYEAGDLDGAVEVNLRVWVDGVGRAPEDVDADVRERVRVMQRRAFELDVPGAGPEEPFDPPASGRLGEISCPALVLVGDLDQPAILEVADRLAAGIADARKEIIRGTAHVSSMERPEEFNRLVLDFLGAAGLRRERA
jgi:pimeloyl-ACP methyl ester carboxylesterase